MRSYDAKAIPLKTLSSDNTVLLNNACVAVGLERDEPPLLLIFWPREGAWNLLRMTKVMPTVMEVVHVAAM
jgi:hypothetical protein